MEEQEPPPFYRSPDRPLSFLKTLQLSLSDPAATIPASIYHQWALKLPGPGFPVVIAHPDSVRQVLLDRGDTFARNRQIRRLLRRAWGKGLAAAEGEDWSRQRRAASPAFRPSAAEAASPLIAQAARRVAEQWSQERPIELSGEMGRIVTQVVMTTLLSGEEEVDFDWVARDIPRVVREVTTFGMLDAAPLPDSLVNRLRRLGHSPQEARLRALASRLAAARAAGPQDGRNLLALLRGTGPLADNAMGFMLAGFETTALGAAWAVYLLSRDPQWQEAVRAEAAASTGARPRLEDLPIARQVAQEALRLYPPAPILARAAMKRTTLQGHKLLPAQAVIIPVYAMHRHQQLWDRPNAFDPARFGPSGSYDRAAYLPFGAGPRLCIAAALALTEITVIVSQLVARFRFAAAGPSPDVSLQISTYSRNGLNVTAQPL